MTTAMSDDLLLTLLWFVPLVGVVIVLFVPKPPSGRSSGLSLGVHARRRFVLTLVAYVEYVVLSSRASGTAGRAGRQQHAVTEPTATPDA